MALSRNQPGMGFVIYEGEVDNGDFDCNFVAGDSLIGGRGNKRERRKT